MLVHQRVNFIAHRQGRLQVALDRWLASYWGTRNPKCFLVEQIRSEVICGLTKTIEGAPH